MSSANMLYVKNFNTRLNKIFYETDYKKSPNKQYNLLITDILKHILCFYRVSLI